jgi:dihydrofolate reductase
MTASGALARARPLVTLIVARAANGVIGFRNALPWHLPEDLRHFKATTLGHVLIMGRRTFDSIGRPLPGRRTVVLTRDPGWQHAGCDRAGSLDEALRVAGAVPEVFVAGGGDIYRQALERADKAIITEVDIAPEGDAFFPPLDPGQWSLIERTPHQSSTGIGYAIAHYRKRVGNRGSATISGSPP